MRVWILGNIPGAKPQSPMKAKKNRKRRLKILFTKLSAGTIAKLIEDEPDAYSIEDAKIRYKAKSLPFPSHSQI